MAQEPSRTSNLVRDTQVAVVAVLGLAVAWYAIEISLEAAGGRTIHSVIWSFLPSAILVATAAISELRRRPYSLHMMHVVALGVLLVFAPAHQLIQGTFPSGVYVPDDELLRANFSVFVWVVCYLSGVAYMRRFVGPIRTRIPLLERRPSNAGYYLMLALAFASLAFLAYRGAAGAQTRAAFNQAVGTTGLEARSLMLIRPLPFVGLGFLLLRWLRQPELRSWTLLSAIALLGIGNLLVNSPLAAARVWTGTILLGLAAILFLSRQRSGVVTAAFLALGLLLLPALNLGRANTELETRMLTPELTAASTSMVSQDFDAYVNLVLIQKLLDFSDITYGRQLMGALLFWVPRSFWPDKPGGSGAKMAERLGLEFTNIASPLPAEALFNFGFWGIPIFAVTFALLLYVLDERYFQGTSESPPGEFRILDGLYPFLLGLTAFATRGDLLNATAFSSGFALAALLPFSFRALAPSENSRGVDSPDLDTARQDEPGVDAPG